MREHLEVDEPRGENAALAVNSRVRGATLPEELLRIGDRAVPHPQILACAQLVADEQPAVDIAGDRAARRGSLRGVRLSAVLHAKERVHDDQKILTERKYFFGVSASFPVSKFVSQVRSTKANTCGTSSIDRGEGSETFLGESWHFSGDCGGASSCFWRRRAELQKKIPATFDSGCRRCTQPKAAAPSTTSSSCAQSSEMA